MIIIFGALVVIGSVAGGFLIAGGSLGALMHISELIIIGGAALGALIIMSPKKILMDLVKRILGSFKGAPFPRRSYDDLLKMLYEMFLLGRRNGMIALEEHVSNPGSSTILQRYPDFQRNDEAVEFLCGSLRPIIDGKIKPDQLRHLIQVDLERMEEESHAPVSVLTRTADAMPGFGIVAAVLGIVITMAGISGPIEEIGEKVAAALVGTFLGIFLAYGFLAPMSVNLEFSGAARLAYFRCIAACVIGFAGGMAPGMAVEIGRRGLSDELRPTATELETMLKALSSPAKPKG
jgi:chemotaxis protein MotA